jgi:hypothetical protein
MWPIFFFAGRNISASHVGFASTRMMKTCAAGQAIGTAAALWLRARHGEPDIAAQSTPDQLRELQQTLLRDDAFLPGLRNEDALDLARSATASASSASPSGPAANVLDGVTRDLKASFGPVVRRCDACVGIGRVARHAHAARAGGPAGNPPDIRYLFSRQLCLSASDTTTRLLIRGPQPETVKHYRVLIDGVVLVEEKNKFSPQKNPSIAESDIRPNDRRGMPRHAGSSASANLCVTTHRTCIRRSASRLALPRVRTRPKNAINVIHGV